MKKFELIQRVAEVSCQPKVVVRSVLDATCDVARVALQGGDSVMLLGLGKLSVAPRAQRTARNIHTGETVTVPAHNGLNFKPSTGLIGAVNGL